MDTVIRTTPSAREANEWALVLAAAGIAYEVEPGDGGFALVVPETLAGRARRALRAYDAESRPEPAPPVPEGASMRTAWLIGIAAGLALIGGFIASGPPDGSRWFARGAAAAGPLLDGEPWRAVTALTLHLDAPHVASNAVATALLLPPIVRRLGPGTALWLVILAGAGANVLAAAAHGAGHVAAGASTATFGAIGILAALRLRPGASRRKTWVVAIAALLLLAMLGTARGSDVLAHALGVPVGAVLGMAATVVTPPLAPRIQWGVLAAALLFLAACWRLALAGGPG